MTWDDSDRRSRLPANWSALVAETKRLAGGRCQWHLPKSGKRCPRNGSECDHKNRGDDHSQSNLQWLCTFHHAKKSAFEGVGARRSKKAPGRKKRRVELDPGRLR